MRVEAGMVDGLPRVAVSDTGCGVPPQERDKIFRRFYRGERSDGAGHGLGLSIAQTIANLHGFQLTVEDNNPGARFESARLGQGVAGPGAGGRVNQRPAAASADRFIQILFSGSARPPKLPNLSIAREAGSASRAFASRPVSKHPVERRRRRVQCSPSFVLL